MVGRLHYLAQSQRKVDVERLAVNGMLGWEGVKVGLDDQSVNVVDVKFVRDGLGELSVRGELDEQGV
jgi:hypothetical protein